jgi:predicted O-linked N-acetylglucosamine transferase (SPINDLY family)
MQASPLDEDIQRVAREAIGLARHEHQAGRASEAAVLYQAVFDIQPGHAEAHHGLGLLAHQAYDLPTAVAHFERALQARPDEEAYWLAYTGALLDAGQVATAREVLALGQQHGLQGAATDALIERLARMESATEPGADEIDAVLAHLRSGHLDAAAAQAQALQARFPRHPFAWKALGGVQHLRGHAEAALQAMRMALELDPIDAETLSNIGLLLKELGRPVESEAPLRRALALKPDYADAHNNLASALLAMGRLHEGEAAARAALALDPASAQAWNNVAVSLQSRNRLADAVQAYRRALALKPDYLEAYSNMLFSMSQMEGVDARALFAAHKAYGELVEGPLRAQWRGHANLRDPGRSLRIGFVSADLRNHAVASFIEPVFERLAGRPGLTLHAYYNHTIHDAVSARLRGYMDSWCEVTGLTDEAMAERIRLDAIDILIDLSGHTAHNRLPVFARKPAPIQATWIGYPATTGLTAMDYYLTDRVILPPGKFDGQFTEKLVHMPLSAPFQPVLDAPPIGPLPALANGHLTFGSFNRLSKISRHVVQVWGRLLRALPDAHLIMAGMPEHGGYEELAAWLAEEGVAAERMRYHPRAGLRDYLALHGQMDICLDTFPYSGGTTTLHALWMGVPTLTLAGDTAAGRQSACILEHTRLAQFIARDDDDFVARGLALAADLDALSQLRLRMRSRIARPSSNKMTQFADGVEDALRMMWRRWCEGLAAASFEVPVRPQPDTAQGLSG